jgi:hypothetical protein
MYNVVLYGGTISRRHKISMVEFKMAMFLNLIGTYNNNKRGFYISYVENLFSSSRYDFPFKYTNNNTNTKNFFIEEFIKYKTKATLEKKLEDINIKRNQLELGKTDEYENVYKLKELEIEKEILTKEYVLNNQKLRFLNNE